MLKRDYLEQGLEGNDRWEGFVIDLVAELSQHLGFEYVIKHVADSRHGSEQPDGTWSGMIGEIVDGKVDLACGDLTMTLMREKVVDFTVPFMNLGISVLYKKKLVTGPSLGMMYFTNPLGDSLTLVFGILFALLTIIVAIICQKYSPMLWFKALVALWAVLLFLFASLYIANLTADVTNSKLGVLKHEGLIEDPAVQSIEDLAYQAKNRITFGSVVGGSTSQFFRDSSIPTYKLISNAMRESSFVRNSQEGVARVKAGGYAFFMESPSIEYAIERDCELYQVGGLLNSKGYGLAVAKESPYREPLSQGILYLQETGTLLTLKNKWWSAGGHCKDH